MVKKDRIAVVVSVVYSLFPLTILSHGDGEGFIGTFTPVVIYWGYRFIKGDISFLKVNND